MVNIVETPLQASAGLATSTDETAKYKPNK